jgi:hypothetical protein
MKIRPSCSLLLLPYHLNEDTAAAQSDHVHTLFFAQHFPACYLAIVSAFSVPLLVMFRFNVIFKCAVGSLEVFYYYYL